MNSPHVCEVSGYTVDDALRYLEERADWLRSEYRKGGDFAYLSLREEECRYVASCIRDTRARLAAAQKPLDPMTSEHPSEVRDQL